MQCNLKQKQECLFVSFIYISVSSSHITVRVRDVSLGFVSEFESVRTVSRIEGADAFKQVFESLPSSDEVRMELEFSAFNWLNCALRFGRKGSEIGIEVLETCKCNSERVRPFDIEEGLCFGETFLSSSKSELSMSLPAELFMS